MRSDNDARKLRRELAKNNWNLSMSAKKVGMDRKTAAKYRDGDLPSEIKNEKKDRPYKTRTSPFTEEHEAELKRMYQQDRKIEAVTLMDYLLEKHTDCGYGAGHLRTLQRRLKIWNEDHESYREALFAQEWHPGKVAQLDWTHMKELEITILGEPFEHRLCHTIFPHSNWSWATICFSESILSLKHGSQEAFLRAGGLPHVLQTDNSSAATHRLSQEDKENISEVDAAGSACKERGFNHKYVAFMKELGVKPETIPVHCPNANGDIESRNGHLKNYIDQRLRLRGFRDFNSRTEYQVFLEECLVGYNRKNADELFLSEEKPLLQSLPAQPLSVYDSETVKVNKESLFTVSKNRYSVPNTLIGEQLTLNIYEDEIQVFHAKKGKLFTIDKLHGSGKVSINFRHLITPLLYKPGAFKNYCHKAQFFPGTQFRRSYDALCKRGERQSSRQYLEILKLAGDHGVVKIDSCLQDILNEGLMPSKELLEIRLHIPAKEYEEKELFADMSEYAPFDKAAEKEVT